MFNKELEGTFQLFSLSHLMGVLVVLSLVSLVYYHRKTLKKDKYFNKVRMTLAILIILQEVSLNIYRITLGEWEISTSLPFQLCGLAVLMSAIVLLTQNKKVFLYSFFMMMIGATLALLTPGIEKQLGFPHYRFFQFFVSHGLIVINFTFILFVMGYVEDVTYKHLLYNFFTLVTIASLAAVINIIVDGNYLYLMRKPDGDTAFDLFGEWPWYLVNILLIGIPIFFHIFYLPFYIRNKLLQKNQLEVA